MKSLRVFPNAAGKSAKIIVAALNKEGVLAPSGGDWGSSTVNGNPKRGNGILNNEMYVGKIVWNRQRFVKEPDTGKRQARTNPESEWVIQEAPELRIIDDELWQAVKARQGEHKIDRDASGHADVAAINYRRRPKYLFSGLTKCACCGGGYAQRRYQMLTDRPCPLAGGKLWKDMSAAERVQDRAARRQISAELGHGRLKITDTYLGSAFA